jgi:prepilin-type N-terminal cleavage/methylation domain-containing protein
MTLARLRARSGFTVIELLIAMMLATIVMGALLRLVDSAQRAFQVQSDVPDMHQRFRASIETMSADIRRAGGVDAPIRPYRVGGARDDAVAGVFFRPDTITLLRGMESVTYSLRSDADGTFDLLQYDGRLSELPLIDHVVAFTLEYFDGAGMPLDPALLRDGPWMHDAAGRSFDADARRVRSVGVRIRLRSALGTRLIPDMEIRFRAARRTAA